MSFGIGIGDIVMLSGLAYTLGKTLTIGRKEAPTEFQEVQNQLFAISNALKLLSGTLQKPEPSEEDWILASEENEILGQMVGNCSVTLKHLDDVIKKYPELQPDSEKEQFGENTRRRWRKEWKDNIKKIKWTTEGADLDKLRHNLATHVNALNLAVAARSCIQTSKVKAQVDVVHGMLSDIYEWYLSNIKDAQKGPEWPKAADSGTTRLRTSLKHEPKDLEPTFSVSIDVSSETLSCLQCPKATFNLGWLHNQSSQLFRCVCGNDDDLGYTLLPVSLLLHLTTARPTWKIHAFSKAHNSVLSLLISEVPSAHLAEFKRCVTRLALTQGLRSSSIGASSMLMYTSVQEDNRGFLSVLNTTEDTISFRKDLRSVNVTSNGFRYVVEAIDSVQMLYYTTILFPDSAKIAEQENPELLPCQCAEIVIHTRTPIDGGNDGDITQLVVQFSSLTVIDDAGSTPGIVLKAVHSKAFDTDDESHDIYEADIELTFASHEAAELCLSSVKSLQRHLFCSYLQSQRLGEVVQFRRNIGDVMIRHMQLLDAQATIVQNLTTNEQRMIINSKCGSKFVTMILPPASLDLPLIMDESQAAPDLPAFFVDISPEGTSIVEQSSGIISALRLPQTEDARKSLGEG